MFESSKSACIMSKWGPDPSRSLADALNIVPTPVSTVASLFSLLRRRETTNAAAKQMKRLTKFHRIRLLPFKNYKLRNNRSQPRLIQFWKPVHCHVRHLAYIKMHQVACVDIEWDETSMWNPGPIFCVNLMIYAFHLLIFKVTIF